MVEGRGSADLSVPAIMFAISLAASRVSPGCTCSMGSINIAAVASSANPRDRRTSMRPHQTPDRSQQPRTCSEPMPRTLVVPAYQSHSDLSDWMHRHGQHLFPEQRVCLLNAFFGCCAMDGDTPLIRCGCGRPSRQMDRCVDDHQCGRALRFRDAIRRNRRRRRAPPRLPSRDSSETTMPSISSTPQDRRFLPCPS
jgi:hypothetical protein